MTVWSYYYGCSTILPYKEPKCHPNKNIPNTKAIVPSPCQGRLSSDGFFHAIKLRFQTCRLRTNQPGHPAWEMVVCPPARTASVFARITHWLRARVNLSRRVHTRIKRTTPAAAPAFAGLILPMDNRQVRKRPMPDRANQPICGYLLDILPIAYSYMGSIR